MGKFIDLTGQRFGRLVVIERMPNNIRKQAVWKCVCDCGKEVVVESGHLRSGHTSSCGCYGHERAADYHRTHGMNGTKLYSVFHAMKCRCYNPHDPKYKDYGARGIKVCDEWLNNPKMFYEWALNNGYEEGLSIDRIDNNKCYSPMNCRWTDSITQANNKRNNRRFEYGGTSKTISEWSRALNLPYDAIKSKIYRGVFSDFLDSIRWEEQA